MLTMSPVETAYKPSPSSPTGSLTPMLPEAHYIINKHEQVVMSLPS